MTTAQLEVSTMSENPFAPNPNLKVWLDRGLVPVAEATVSVFDHGLLYGDGVFEGIRIYNGRIFKEADHIRRFFESAKAIKLDLPIAADELSEAMYETLRANGLGQTDGYIRLICTRGTGKLGISIYKAACPRLIIIADQISLYPAEVYERGLRCIVSNYVRNHINATSPRVKSLNYLNNVLAKAEANDCGADEAIMLTAQGYVSECTGDNIFLVRRGQVYTPPLSEGVLEGITREVVIELARKRGLVVHEKQLLRHDLYIADECFGTGTAAELVPITEIDRRPVGDGKPGPVTRQLLADFIAYRTRT